MIKNRFILVMLHLLLQQVVIGQDTSSLIEKLNKSSQDSLYKNPPKSLKWADSALSMSEERQYVKGKINAYVNLGNYYHLVGPQDRSIIYYTKALRLAQTGQDSASIMNIYFSLGESYYTMNNVDKSIQIFKKVFDYNLRDTANLYRKVDIIQKLAGGLYDRGHYEKSLLYFNMALEMQENLGRAENLAIAYNNVGSTYRKLHQYQKGLRNLEKAESIATKHRLNRVLAVIYLSQGEIYNDLKQYKKANLRILKSLQKSKNIYVKTYCNGLLQYAVMKLEQQRYFMAKQKAKEALRISSDSKNIMDQKRAYKILTQIYEQTNEPKKALKTYKAFHTLQDSLLDQRNTEAIAKMRIQYETENHIRENNFFKDQHIKNTEIIHRAKRTNVILVAFIIVVIILTGLLLSSYVSARENNKKLEIKTQESNEAYNNMAMLNDIGRTVMSELLVEKIADRLYERVNQLMDASVFGIALYRQQENALYFEGVKEKGETLAPFSQSLNEEHLYFAGWSFKNNKEVFINNLIQEYHKYDVEAISSGTVHLSADQINESTKMPLSLIYLPLLDKNKPMGVITVQSFECDAYSEYELNLLRNLGNYVSTALINALAYDEIRAKKNKIKAQKTALDRQNTELHAQQKELQSILRDLQNTQSQLVQSEKLSLLGELTAGIAHEINNSINFVYAGTDVLKQYLQELIELVEKYDEISPENYSDKLKEIERFKKSIVLDEIENEIFGLIEDISCGAERTTEIVKNLQTFSRLDEKSLKYTDLHKNLDATLAILRNRYRDRIQLTKNYASNFPFIQCYPGEINQVFMSIINNAIQAIQSTGAIYISTQFIERQQQDTCPIPLPSVEITIQDTGTGIDKEILDHIFDPFFTTKEAGISPGLGLHIAMEIIHKHHGKIVVDSKLEEGSTFKIYLPLDQSVKKT